MMKKNFEKITTKAMRNNMSDKEILRDSRSRKVGKRDMKNERLHKAERLFFESELICA